MGFQIILSEEENNIIFTQHTIKNYRISHIKHPVDSDRDVSTIELEGKIDLHDFSDEFKQILTLTRWAIKKADSEDSYKGLTVITTNHENTVTETIQYQQVFVVDYDEKFRIEKGVGAFRIVLREFCALEEPVS